MAVADTVSRRRFGHEAMLLGQIGIETAPCPGDCGFCVFGESHTQIPKNTLSMEEILARAEAFTRRGDLYALFLMTMHDFTNERLLEIIQAVRKCIPPETQIVVNIGDFDIAQGQQLRSAGVHGAYHVCRLREGTDTSLSPEDRKKTFRTIRDAGLDFYYCCEPIGPEHTPEELVEQIFLGVGYGCFQHAAMRRVFVSGMPLSDRGQITELRLAQIVAVVTLATLGCQETQNIAVHEPNLLGLTAGANVVYTETGANPRDTEVDTSSNRGLDMPAARKMLYEAGFTALRLGNGRKIALDLPYLVESAVDDVGRDGV
ncbi:MAG: radical SAM protein [Planctomycetaceae bacterium]|nr:MAG: radical SAM protein [Planctomycetaceae bacterium]